MLAALMLMASCANRKSEDKSTQTKQDSIAEVYHCPMACEGDKTYDKPGKCPVCKMDLTKKEKQ